MKHTLKRSLAVVIAAITIIGFCAFYFAAPVHAVEANTKITGAEFKKIDGTTMKHENVGKDIFVHSECEFKTINDVEYAKIVVKPMKVMLFKGSIDEILTEGAIKESHDTFYIPTKNLTRYGDINGIKLEIKFTFSPFKPPGMKNPMPAIFTCDQFNKI